MYKVTEQPKIASKRLESEDLAAQRGRKGLSRG